jgi:hypothetical protein
MNPNTTLILDIAAYLQGAVINASVVIPLGPQVIHLWAFETSEGVENTLVIQQRERQFLRWKRFPGPLTEAKQHYLRRQRERRRCPVPGRAETTSSSVSAAA